MPSIFLSHTSVDKPFVEKLAKDLKRIGVDVWFDKWSIGVGDSLTWRIEEGIRENEFLGIVLSPESLDSEWVKSELGAAWSKQMRLKKVTVLPILYRKCDIPHFLSDRKYADFRSNYDDGFRELARVFGIRETDTISIENWRTFAKSRTIGWQRFRVLEFERLVTALVDRAKEFNWSSWVTGTKNPLTISLRTLLTGKKDESVAIKLVGRTHAYYACRKDVFNPAHLKAKAFDIYVGNSINECEEFVWRIMDNFRRRHGDPVGKAHHSIHRHISMEETVHLTKQMMKSMSWYQGDELL